MVRLLNASISQPPPPGPRVEDWKWGWRGARPWLRVHDVRVWECWGTLFSRITQQKINCNENTNNDKCSLPVIVLPSLWSTSSWSSEKPCSNCSPERHLNCISACFLYNFRLKTIRPRPVREILFPTTVPDPQYELICIQPIRATWYEYEWLASSE